MSIDSINEEAVRYDSKKEVPEEDTESLDEEESESSDQEQTYDDFDTRDHEQCMY